MMMVEQHTLMKNIKLILKNQELQMKNIHHYTIMVQRNKLFRLLDSYKKTSGQYN